MFGPRIFRLQCRKDVEEFVFKVFRAVAAGTDALRSIPRAALMASM